jgi:hypothetical protein
VYIRRIRVDPCPILAWLSSYLVSSIAFIGFIGFIRFIG